MSKQWYRWVVAVLAVSGVVPATLAGATDLKYYGGGVIAQPKIHNLFISANWDQDNPLINEATINIVTANLVNGYYSSQYFGRAAQYGIGTATFTGSHNISPLGDPCPTQVGGSIDILEIDACVAFMVGQTSVDGPTWSGSPLPDENTLYVVYVPSNTQIVDGTKHSCNDFRTYHSWSFAIKWYWYPVGSLLIPLFDYQKFVYVVVPLACTNNQRDQLSVLMSHEIIEAETDPYVGSGWIDMSVFGGVPQTFKGVLTKGEVADICEGAPAIRDGDGDLVAPYWSNSDAACVPQGPPPIFSLDQNNLPAKVPHLAEFDGTTVTLPFSKFVGHGTQHTYAFHSPVYDPLTPGKRWVTDGTTHTVTVNSNTLVKVNYTPEPYTQLVQQGSKLVGSGAVGAAIQGASVAISADGNTAIVGGPYDNTYIGAAWVFTRSGVAWPQQGTKLVGSGFVGSAAEGWSVAISADGNTAIVGAQVDNHPAGAAWVFTRSGGVWSQQGLKLVGTGAVGGALQGTSVAISGDGNTAIVGGPLDDSPTGAAWVFTRSGGVWSQQGLKLVGTGAVGGAYQGGSVAISANGNTAILGGYADSSLTGAAWVFTRSGGVWSQQGLKLVGTGAVGDAGQGYSVAISADGNTAIVGGWTDNQTAGAAWVYTRSGGMWSQQGPKLVGTGAVGGAYQGGSVAISADGNTAIVGGPVDNSRTGGAWVFTRSGGVWSQRGLKLVGTGAVGAAMQGQSVAISADGTTAIVGGSDDNSQTGAAWVFAPWDCVAPSITAQPQNATVPFGQAATLSVTATGSPSLWYDWYQDTPGDTSMPVGTGASTFTTPVLADTTSYWVRVSNACGQADSGSATVCSPPSITNHPGARVKAGLTFTLSVTATGTGPLGYQWYQGAAGDASQPVAGANASSFATPVLAVDADYWVRVSNACGYADSDVRIPPQDLTGPIASSERQALIDLYSGTGGAEWTKRTNWRNPANTGFNVSGTECNWYGVTCAALPTKVYTVQLLVLDSNNLAGTLPVTLSNLTNLVGLYLNDNQVTGSIPTSLGSLPILMGLYLQNNRFSGSIPTQLGSLTNLIQLNLGHNQLTGSIPTELGSLMNLQYLDLNTNQLAGSIPTWLGSLTKLQKLDLSINHFPGSIPTQLGSLTNLQFLSLNGNMLSGSIPTSFESLTKLVVNQSDLRYNALSSSDATLTAFLNDGMQYGSDWQSTQTVAPTGVAAGATTNTSVALSWTPIAYTGDTGGYRAYYSTTSGGPYTSDGITAAKSASSIVVSGLNPSTLYYLVVRTVTNPHANNPNTVTSDPSAEVHATTGGGTCTSPSITTQPQSQTIQSGQTATLSVIATGTAPLSYQWYQGSSGDTSHAVGTNATSFASPALTTSTSYWVRVSNACGHADSATATVTVGGGCTSPSITAQPQSQTIASGQTATLTVTAAGTAPLSYQWYQGSPILPSSIPVGSNSSSFTTPALTATTSYWVRVSDSCGQHVDSNTVTITVGQTGLVFRTLTPCRALDTRLEGGALAANTYRSITIMGRCGVPSSAQAISANFTVTNMPGVGFLRVYPEAGPPTRDISTLNFDSHEWALANAAIVPLRTGGALTLYAAVSQSDVIIDVNGYFTTPGAAAQTPSEAGELSGVTVGEVTPEDTTNAAAVDTTFHPVSPCRVLDTRLGGQTSLGTAEARAVTIVGGTCGIPAGAASVAANFTVTDEGSSGYLSVYPEPGAPSRDISTMNFTYGQWALANAALVPLRSDGGITVFNESARTDLIIDVSGYFSTSGIPGLTFYPLTPCRVVDSRLTGGALAANTYRRIQATGGQCGVPTDAQAISANFTVTNMKGTGFLRVYPEDGAPTRDISTLNFSSNQWALANAAIMPLQSGFLTVYAAASQLDFIIDVNGYFK
ncbi:MAG: fibronectin type III domain-containing protein [Thermoanaerobaculales bacterium]